VLNKNCVQLGLIFQVSKIIENRKKIITNKLR